MVYRKNSSRLDGPGYDDLLDEEYDAGFGPQQPAPDVRQHPAT